MAKRPIALLAILLMLGFAVAGCGDDEGGDGSGSADTAAETVTEDETVDETVTDDTDTGTGTDADTDTATEQEREQVPPETDTDTTPENGGARADSRQKAVDACRESVERTPNLSEDTKSDLEDVCEQAASGDDDALRETARRVCREIVEGAVPEGSPGREAALDACDRNR